MPNKTLEYTRSNAFSIYCPKIPLLNQVSTSFSPPSLDTSPVGVKYQGSRIPIDSNSLEFSPITFEVNIDLEQQIVLQIYEVMNLMNGNEEIYAKNEVIAIEEYKFDLTVSFLKDGINKDGALYQFFGCVIDNFQLNPLIRGSNELLTGSLTMSFDYLKIING